LNSKAVIRDQLKAASSEPGEVVSHFTGQGLRATDNKIKAECGNYLNNQATKTRTRLKEGVPKVIWRKCGFVGETG
jgi:hypothetical protein